MKKRILSIFLAAIMVAGLLAGCGGQSVNNPNEGQSAAPAEQQSAAPAENNQGGSAVISNDPADHDTSKMAGKKVGFTLPSVGNDFMKYLSQAVSEELAKYDVTCQIDSCDGSETTQINQMDNYISAGMDMIIAFPVNGNSLVDVSKRAEAAGIPVLAFAMEISDEVSCSMISAEEKDMGEACAKMVSEWIDKTFPDAGEKEVKVYHMSYAGTPESKNRSEAQKTLAEINPKVDLISEDVSDWNDQADASNRLENALLVRTYDVIMCVNGSTAKGAEAYSATPASSSYIADKSKFGIFCVDEDEQIIAKITDPDSALRGTVSMGSIQDTVNDFMKGAFPILCEEEIVHRINGAAIIITEDTVNK